MTRPSGTRGILLDVRGGLFTTYDTCPCTILVKAACSVSMLSHGPRHTTVARLRLYGVLVPTTVSGMCSDRLLVNYKESCLYENKARNGRIHAWVAASWSFVLYVKRYTKDGG